MTGAKILRSSDSGMKRTVFQTGYVARGCFKKRAGKLTEVCVKCMCWGCVTALGNKTHQSMKLKHGFKKIMLPTKKTVPICDVAAQLDTLHTCAKYRYKKQIQKHLHRTPRRPRTQKKHANTNAHTLTERLQHTPRHTRKHMHKHNMHTFHQQKSTHTRPLTHRHLHLHLHLHTPRKHPHKDAHMYRRRDGRPVRRDTDRLTD